MVRSWQYSSNRGFFHEQYIMNSLESIKALCLLTYKLRKCSHSVFVSLDLSHRLMNSLQAQPSSYYKTSHLRDKKPLSLTPDQSIVAERCNAHKNSLYKQNQPGLLLLEITKPCENNHQTLLSTNTKQQPHNSLFFIIYFYNPEFSTNAFLPKKPGNKNCIP